MSRSVDILMSRGVASVIREEIIQATRAALESEGYDTNAIEDTEILELAKQIQCL